jgi:hypothetical protein
LKTQKWAGEQEHGQDLGREEGLSALLPWQRPGWRYGRGAYWYLYEPYQPAVPPIKAEGEAILLAEQKKLMEEQLQAIQETLKKIQERMNELNK